tara:strand:+ start:1133 stop:1330 length:198 start_codon:yes stop_codon:yes gene_type:complete
VNGQFIVKVGNNLLEFSNYNDIPDTFDNVVVFKPDYPEPPHTEEEHNFLGTFNDKLKELMKRETK